MPLNFCRYVSRFLELESNSASCEVTGKWVNCGEGYGMEVPSKYTFWGIGQAVTWLNKCITKEDSKIMDAIADNEESRNKTRKNSDLSDASAVRKRWRKQAS